MALTASEPSARISIALSKGALVTVRVNDPAQLLPAHEGKSLGAHFLLGLSNDADLFRPAALVSQDAAGRTYQILAPFDRTIHIAAASGFFQLADAVGRPLPSFGTRIPVLVSSGQPAAALLLSVAGLTSSAAAR